MVVCKYAGGIVRHRVNKTAEALLGICEKLHQWVPSGDHTVNDIGHCRSPDHEFKGGEARLQRWLISTSTVSPLPRHTVTPRISSARRIPISTTSYMRLAIDRSIRLLVSVDRPA